MECVGLCMFVRARDGKTRRDRKAERRKIWFMLLASTFRLNNDSLF